jgi:hypothetical protein
LANWNAPAKAGDATDCTWFASGALWAGGHKKVPGTWASPSDAIAINANSLVEYLRRKGKATKISVKWSDNTAGGARVGDLIAYDWNRGWKNLAVGSDGIIDHLAVVTSLNAKGQPSVTQHSPNRQSRFWSWDPSTKKWIENSMPGAKVYLIRIQDAL